MTGAGRLIGRDQELRALRARLDGAAADGCAVVLVGEAGVGKSVLQAAVVEDARARRFSVLTGRGSEAETHLPFGGLHQVLRPVLPHAERLPVRQRDALLAGFGMSREASSDPFLLALAVLELVVEEARRAPVLLSLDDAHWMDEPTVDVISFLARRIEGERVLLLASARPGSAVVRDDSPFERVAVAGIDAGSASALLAERAPDLPAGVRRRVLREAGGNPLALTEFAEALRPGRLGWTESAEDLPMTARLERTFAARVAELPVPTGTVLRVAALSDSTDLAEVLAASAVVLGTPVDARVVEPALAEGLLESDGVSAQFRHPLVRSAVRHATPLVDRQSVHRALAEVLAAGHPDRAAWHRASSIAAPDEQVAADLERAARGAHRRGAAVSAVGWLERAAVLSPDPAVRASRLLGAAEIAFELGRSGQVQQIRQQLAGMPLPPRERWRLTWLEGVFDDGCSAEPAEVRRLVGLAEQALDAEDLELAVQLLVGAARRVWWVDPGADVRSEIVRVARSASLPDHDPRLLAVCALAQSHECGPFVLGQLAGWPADAAGRPDLAGLLGIAAFCVGDFARATSFLSSPVEELRGQGRLSLLAEALAIRAWAAIYLGAFDLAQSADEAVRMADETGQSTWAATARIALAVLGAVRGPLDSGAALLSAAERVAVHTPNATSSLLAAVQLARGLAELGADRHEEAHRHLRRVFDPGDPAFHRAQQVWTLGYLVDAAVPTGRRDDARAQLARIEDLVGAHPAPGAALALEYSRAVLADDVDAEALFHAALDGAGRRLPWHRARAELAYGSWLRRQRRLVDSRVPLQSARGTFEALGARAWAGHADRELRATGDRGWRPTAGPAESLSPQEAQIARLAAEGLSNREIAQRLYLSHRTIGSHLYRIFPKLGVTSRAQLAAVLGPRADGGPVV